MKTEKTLAGIFLIALTLRLLNASGGTLLLILSLLTISMLYFWVGFYFFSDKTIKQQNLSFSIVGGIFLAFVPIGLLFKILFWPGALTTLGFGLIATLVLLIICITTMNKKEELKKYYNNYLMRLSFWFIIGVIFYITPPSTLIKIQYREDPEFVRLKTKVIENPDNLEYFNEWENYQQKSDSIKHAKP